MFALICLYLFSLTQEWYLLGIAWLLSALLSDDFLEILWFTFTAMWGLNILPLSFLVCCLVLSLILSVNQLYYNGLTLHLLSVINDLTCKDDLIIAYKYTSPILLFAAYLGLSLPIYSYFDTVGLTLFSFVFSGLAISYFAVENVLPIWRAQQSQLPNDAKNTSKKRKKNFWKKPIVLWGLILAEHVKAFACGVSVNYAFLYIAFNLPVKVNLGLLHIVPKYRHMVRIFTDILIAFCWVISLFFTYFTDTWVLWLVWGFIIGPGVSFLSFVIKRLLKSQEGQHFQKVVRDAVSSTQNAPWVNMLVKE